MEFTAFLYMLKMNRIIDRCKFTFTKENAQKVLKRLSYVVNDNIKLIPEESWLTDWINQDKTLDALQVLTQMEEEDLQALKLIIEKWRDTEKDTSLLEVFIKENKEELYNYISKFVSDDINSRDMLYSLQQEGLIQISK